MFYIIFINVSLITISTILSIYFDMEWNLQLPKSNSRTHPYSESPFLIHSVEVMEEALCHCHSKLLLSKIL